MNGYSMMRPMDLEERMARVTPPRLVDVRDLDEFAGVHLRGAQSVPLPTLLSRASSWRAGDELVLICQSGQRAREAAGQLRDAGFDRLSVVEGGTRACVAAGVPSVRGRKRLPIQRQVFIGAGLVVLGGLSMSFLHPAFELISWFAASSLVLAGISGFCPMARLLAFAPWNRDQAVPESQAATSCGAEGGCS